MNAFIDEHRGAYGVEPICRVLPIAPSTYREHAARQRDPSRRPARARRDEVLKVEIRRERPIQICQPHPDGGCILHTFQEPVECSDSQLQNRDSESLEGQKSDGSL